MARKRLNRGYLEISLYLSITVCIGIAFTYLLFNSTGFFLGIAKVFRVLRPILVGFFLAYLLLPLVRRVEFYIVSNVFPRKSKKFRYVTSVFITYILFLLFAYAFFYALLPQIVNSIIDNIQNLKKYEQLLGDWLIELNERYAISKIAGWTDEEVYAWSMGLLGSGIEWLSSQMPDFVSQAINMASALFNALVSFVVSIYVVLDKDTFKGQFKKMLFALFPPHVVDTVVRVLKDVDRMFGGFVSGKFIDSVIIGILFFVFMKLLHIPESVLISVVMGVANMIPTFGPFMGGIPCVIFMVFVDYRYALTLAILIIVLQQFDGNVLDPKILGDSLGISAFWVVFSVVFFGGIFGVWGMFFGVPTFAVLYKETGELIDYLLRKKRYPVSREAYAKAGFSPRPVEEQPQE